MQLILDKNITPPVRQVSQLPSSTKKTKPYSKATQEPLKKPHKKGTEHLKIIKITKKYGLRSLNKKNRWFTWNCILLIFRSRNIEIKFSQK